MAEMSYREDILSLANLQLPWEKLKGSNILVTGATGLIGSTLVDVLLSRGVRDYCVYACGRNENRANKLFSSYWNTNNFKFMKFDITHPLSIDIPFHYIIHCASGAAPVEFGQRPVEVMKANIIGVDNLLSYGNEHSMNRMLYVSSGEIYGEGDGREFSEDYSGYVDPLKTRSCYPSSKRAAETLCASYCAEYGVDVVIARPCHVYGPHFTENDNRVYAQFIRNVLRGENIMMKSTGEQYRSWCYVVDTVSALLQILLKGQRGEAYNIADPNSIITIKELAHMVAEYCGQEVIIDVPDDMEKQTYNPVTKSVFQTSKIEKLGWRIEGCMVDKIESTIKEYKHFSHDISETTT